MRYGIVTAIVVLLCGPCVESAFARELLSIDLIKILQSTQLDLSKQSQVLIRQVEEQKRISQ